MGLDYQTIELPLVAGLNQKHDPRSLPTPQLLDLENAVFDKHGGLQKCPGRKDVSLVSATGPTSLTDLKALMAYKDELLIVRDNDVFTRAPTAGKDGSQALGVVERCRFESVRTEYKPVSPFVASTLFADRAENAGVILYAWQSGSATITYRVIDEATGAQLNELSLSEPYSDQTIASAIAPKVRAVGAKLHLYYVDTTAAPRTLKVLVIDPADVQTTLTPTALSIATDVKTGLYEFDVDIDANSVAYLVYRNDSDQYTVKSINAQGTVTTTTAKARGCVGMLSVSVSSTGQLLVVRHNTTTTVHADWLTASTHADLTVSIVVISGPTPVRITGQATGNQVGYAFFDTLYATAYSRVYRVRVTTVVTSTKILVRHSRLASRAVLSDDSRVLVHVVLSTGTLQTQYVLLDAETVVGNTGQDGGAGTQDAGDEVGMLARLFPGEAVHAASFIHLPQIENPATDEYKIALVYNRRLTVNDPRVSQVTTERALRDVVYTFADARAYDAVEIGQCLYIPGGYLAAYDGKRVQEAGFWVFPEITATALTAINDAAGGLTSGETYNYRLYWEWYNDPNERERSTFAGSVTKQLTGAGNNAFSIVVPTLPYTVKGKVVLAVYRTEGNSATGAPYYRASHPLTGELTYLENDPNADTITWKDIDYNDVELLSNELDYQNTGELDNVPPAAPPLAIAMGQGRIFYIHPEDEHGVHYSKIRQEGTIVAFNEALAITTPDAGGRVTGVSPGEDAVLMFKETAVYLASGRGPDNLGVGDYDQPRLVTADQGCADPRSIVRIPPGVMFKGEKGWHLVDGAYQVHFIGGPVEDLNSRTVTGVLAHPAEHRVVVLTSHADGSYAYDYLTGQWSDWPTLASIVDGAMSIGLAYYLEPSAKVSVETPAAFANLTPGGYSCAWDSGWIKPGDLQGFYRMRWFEILGEWQGAQSFDVRIRIAYDYDNTWVDDATWSPPTTMETAGKPLRVRCRPTRPKASAIRIRVEDIQRGSNTNWGEGVRWTGLALSVAKKRGLRPLPANQTKGA